MATTMRPGQTIPRRDDSVLGRYLQDQRARNLRPGTIQQKIYVMRRFRPVPRWRPAAATPERCSAFMARTNLMPGSAPTPPGRSIAGRNVVARAAGVVADRLQELDGEGAQLVHA